MEQSPAERYEIYTSDNPLPNPHPAPSRPTYVPENTGERSLSPPIFVRPLGPAVPLPRKPRSVMYKAKIHDLLIYASLIISALALILATRNGSTQGIVVKGKEMAEKTTELVHLVPQPGKTSQPDQPEAVIHLKFPSYPPIEASNSPLQRFLAYLHPDHRPANPAVIQTLAFQELLRTIINQEPQLNGLSVSDLSLIERFLAKDMLAERETVDLLVRLLLLHTGDQFTDDEEPRRSSSGSKRHDRLRGIVDVLRPSASKRQDEKERERLLEEKEAELGRREKQVVEALNTLAKEREKDQ